MKKLFLPLMAFLLAFAVGCDTAGLDDEVIPGAEDPDFVRFAGETVTSGVVRTFAAPVGLRVLVPNTVRNDVTVTFELSGDAVLGEDYEVAGEGVSLSGTTGTLLIPFEPEDGLTDFGTILIVPLDEGDATEEAENVVVTLTGATAGGQSLQVGESVSEEESTTRTVVLVPSAGALIVGGEDAVSEEDDLDPPDDVENDDDIDPVTLTDSVDVGMETDLDFTMTNFAPTRAVTLTDFMIVGAGAEQYELEGLGEDSEVTIAAGETEAFTIAFEADTIGLAPADLLFTTMNLVADSSEVRVDSVVDGTVYARLPLEATGLSGNLVASTDTLSFEDLTPNEEARQTVTLTNNGNAPLTVTGLTVTGDDADRFETFLSPPFTLAPDESREVEVEFNAPSDAGDEAAATLTFTTDGAFFTPSVSVQLVGNVEEEEEDR